MIKSLRKNIGLLAIVSLLTFGACDREPIPPPQPKIEKISIAELKDMFSDSTIEIDTAVYIQGIVTLTPEKNNIPDFVGYMQDASGGITLTIDGNNTLAEGSEIKIMCKGIELTEYNGLLQFGNIDLGTQSEMINLVATPPTAVSTTIQNVLDGEHIAELVSISDVEFASKGTFSGNQILTNCSEEISVHTRSDAIFSGDAIPEGNGTFVGVASVYNDAQLLLRDPTDLDMTGTRCSPFFDGIFEEDFETLEYNDEVTELTGWSNPLEAGDRTWIARTYSGNAYIQASAFNSDLVSMISWMVTPSIDLSGATAPVLTFGTKTGYHNGASLTVKVSTDYDGSGSPWNYTWTDLSPTLANGPDNAYLADWVSSGDIDLSSYNSTIYIAFVYNGQDDPADEASDRTTTWQIDNVTIDESSK